MEDVTQMASRHKELTDGVESVGVYNQEHRLVQYLASAGKEHEPLRDDGEIPKIFGQKVINQINEKNPNKPVPQWIIDEFHKAFRNQGL